MICHMPAIIFAQKFRPFWGHWGWRLIRSKKIITYKMVWEVIRKFKISGHDLEITIIPNYLLIFERKKNCPFVVLLDTAKFCLQKRPFVRYDIKVNFYYWDHDIFFMLSIPLNIAKLLKITKKYKLTFYISWLWPRPRVSMASLVFFFIPTWFIWYLTYNSRLILSCLIFHMPGIVFAHKLRPFWGHRDGRSLGAEKNFQYFGETI